MGISLKKGQGVSLKKSEHDLSMVTIGLGWDINDAKKGLLGGLMGKKEADYDLDVVAFLCGANGKVRDLGRDEKGQATLVNSDVIFFNNQRHRSGCIWLTGDNRTGSGNGDDEQIIVKLNDLPEAYAKVVFVVQIYQGAQNGQSFGQVRNAFIRAEDAKGREMARFDLSGGAQYEDCRSLLFAELEREAGGWALKAIGAPSPSDSFVEWLKRYA
ncbi:TerD family protein [Thiocystis violacea]|uniref:TerD family protein n=1 Tax=Thiocystis violacea TaxID=13725 RepID=UPI001908CD5B|nr:TerD family protein [Thiocystis violacea]MBK1722486.1 tellurium resistance protein TerX [Thiocystis violacea]